MSRAARILVVDDEPHARTALAELLGLDGHVVETAGDGQQGLSKFAEFRPDLVITDLKMPRLDGLGMMNKIHQEVPQLPVILMTAYAGTEAGRRALAAGAAACLAKPLDFDELSQNIEQALTTHRPPG